MRSPILSLLVLSCAQYSIRGALYAYLDEDAQDDLVYELEIGEDFQLTCKGPSEKMEFYVVGIFREIHNNSGHDDFFPGTNPTVTAVSEFYDNSGHTMFQKSLRLTVVSTLNGIAFQCGARGYDKVGRKTIWAYSRGVLLKVGDASENVTSAAGPPYVDIGLVDHGDRKVGDRLHVECNSSSEYIAFCVVGTSCDSDYIHGLPNGTNSSLSDTLGYYNNASGRTLYQRTLELSVVPELDNMALQCRAGNDVQGYTKTVLLKAGSDHEVHPTPTVSESCPSPSVTALSESTCGGLSPRLRSMWKLVFSIVFILQLNNF